MKYHIKNGRVLILENETLNVVEKDLFVADGRIVGSILCGRIHPQDLFPLNRVTMQMLMCLRRNGVEVSSKRSWHWSLSVQSGPVCIISSSQRSLYLRSGKGT